jgi:broad specificity phosphatase PhoE
MPRLLLAPLLGLAAVTALTALAPAPRPMGPRVVVLVRHAEVSQDGSGDPPLSDAGRLRAETLARIAAAYDVEAAFVTPFRRTTHTAGPAAEWLGLKPEAVPIPGGGVPAHVADLAERIRRAPGAGVLVVGHSNTVPAVVLALTGQDVGPIGEDEFDRLFVVRLPADGPPTVEELTY